MEMSPKAISSMTFPLSRKGYDQEQVRTFLAKVARGIEELQARMLQAEAKARLVDAPPEQAPLATPAAPASPDAGVDSITRTLLIAQRTADAAVAEARDEADAVRREAEERAETVLSEARARANNLVTAAEAEATRAGDLITEKAQGEVTALEGRRQLLLDDIDRLTSHVTEQRERIAATVDVLQRALDHPDGLRELPRPELQAPAASLPPPPGALGAGDEGGSAEAPADQTGEIPRPDDVGAPSWSDAPANGEAQAGGDAVPAPPPAEPAPAPEPPAPPEAASQPEQVAQETAAATEVPGEPSAAEQEGDTGAWRRFFEGGPSADDRWKK
ncbi:MAG TPA: DivIVA domain-containing protein [Acidimicrobiales bacterium]|jgi:DivIVA domain-containing protein|nr:DivIVA domain-containing protein [Acidimicrobiales bacterium]